MTAEDQDLGFNDQLVYVISSGDKDAVFGINMTSGMVSVIAPLDREKTAEYFLNITACDQGKHINPLSSNRARRERQSSSFHEIGVLLLLSGEHKKRNTSGYLECYRR